MRHDATVDRILQRVIPGARVQRSILDALLRDKPKPETLVALLAAADAATVRAAVLYLGLYGTVCESAVLALCLHHDDQSVVRLAEHCLWSIWMQSGSEEGNRHLAAAVACMKTGDHAAAIQVLDDLVAREPEFAEAQFQRGLALASAEKTAEAEDAYRQALRLNPYHFGAAAALGHACVERGHLQAALHFYRQALKIHPQLEDVPDAVHELESAFGTRRHNGV